MVMFLNPGYYHFFNLIRKYTREPESCLIRQMSTSEKAQSVPVRKSCIQLNLDL